MDQGGFLTARRGIIRPSFHGHSASLVDSVSETDIKALNAIQGTAWSINTFILDALKGCLENRIEVGKVRFEASLVPDGMNYEAFRAAMGRRGTKLFSDEEWAAMSDAQRKDHLRRIAQTHQHNAKAAGNREALNDCIAVAEDLRDEPAIYFPHNRDFRGRVYPMTNSSLQPQGADHAKALLKFAQGVPLGLRGVYWLCVRAASLYGHDKMPLDERAEWADQHTAQMLQAARDPLGCSWWRVGTDKPWQLLATCHEIAQALSYPDGPHAFPSHLPVPLDATCSGIQHLSAMVADQQGAMATNLTAAPDRKDIYLDVADAAEQHMRADLEADDKQTRRHAREWLRAFGDKKTRRDLVKRAVMTTPYGVTARGIETQLFEEGRLSLVEEDARTGALKYLRQRIEAGLEALIGSARAVMQWLRDVATLLSKAGLPFDWKTPSGSTIRQSYRVMSETRIRTLCGRMSLVQPENGTELDNRKQAAGAPPNFVHSFDAAHLYLTVHRLSAGGVNDFALIHDSFGVHAAHTDELAKAVRATFVDIYRSDWIERTAEFVASYAPEIVLPPRPPRGSFDVAEVRKAAFAFS